ncbi:NfeD family protein [Myxosarcina sp. GI1]|uniref:NfeD family protein n=1 Tax=Myxosarcina sp. GI1 TaxID=1541065 RepID=UPI00055F7140|nr:NfeD family protein [Myxosarcina sp. GI1]
MPDPTLMWLIAGIILCGLEFFLPTAFVTFMMGIAALLVAIVSLVLAQDSVLVALWLLLSTLLTILTRRFFTPKRKASITSDDSEGETLTVIPAGKSGRVLYEGNSWRAKCADETREIAANELVYVVGKKGNTLIVLPVNMLSD